MNLKLPEPPKGLQPVPHAKALDCWNRAVTAKAGDDTITILDEIGENWDGTGVTPKRIEGALRSIGDKPVTVIINSPGGNLFDGLAIFNMLKNHSQPVTVQIVGVAGSAASIIAMAGDDIQIAKAGMLFIHNSQWIAIGDKQVMLQAHNDMTVFDEVIAASYNDRTNLALEDIHAMMDAETFIKGEDAVAQGFCDRLLPSDELVEIENSSEPAHRKVAAALRKANMPRAEIRKLMKELSEDMPSAASEPVMPSADNIDEGLARLRAASMRLRLTS